ncbi:MAG: esterase/lipase family protein [Alphaproteobacteria bacterium]
MAVKTAVDIARLQADLVWAGSELAWGATLAPFLLRRLPKAQSTKAVMTIPGFLRPEWSMGGTNALLNRLGYQATGWGEGQNLGPKGDGNALEYLMLMSQRLGQRIMQMADDTGDKVSLIGQSLGGLYARELSFLMPDHIDRVIALGSPTQLHPDTAHHTNRVISVAMERATGKRIKDMAGETWMLNRPTNIPPVPFVSIYSPYDGVLREDTVAISGEEMRRESEHPRENIEVLCSHAGMAVNPLTLIAVADRLAADVNDWQHFDIAKYVPGPLKNAARAIYPHARGYDTVSTAAAAKPFTI